MIKPNEHLKIISREVALQIGTLALNYSNTDFVERDYYVSIGGTTIWRHFEHQKLLCSIFLILKENHQKGEKGIQLNVMKNGDVFGREFPFYDGDIDLLPIYNQRQIFDLIESKIAFEDCLRTEFLFATSNYPEQYHKLFEEKFKRAEYRYKEVNKLT